MRFIPQVIIVSLFMLPVISHASIEGIWTLKGFRCARGSTFIKNPDTPVQYTLRLDENYFSKEIEGQNGCISKYTAYAYSIVESKIVSKYHETAVKVLTSCGNLPPSKDYIGIFDVDFEINGSVLTLAHYNDLGCPAYDRVLVDFVRQ